MPRACCNVPQCCLHAAFALNCLSSRFLIFLVALAVACYHIGCWSASLLAYELAIGLTGLSFLAGCAIYDVVRQIHAASRMGERKARIA